MTRVDELFALAERCEEAKEPDRYLDAQIASVMRLEKVPHWARTWTGEWKPTEQGSVVLMEADGKPGPHFMAREYTGSLDAARTLMPEGAVWKVEDHPSYGPRAVVEDCEAYAVDPILALCAAALRAKATVA